jgi:hypothetical protein
MNNLVFMILLANSVTDEQPSQFTGDSFPESCQKPSRVHCRSGTDSIYSYVFAMLLIWLIRVGLAFKIGSRQSSLVTQCCPVNFARDARNLLIF